MKKVFTALVLTLLASCCYAERSGREEQSLDGEWQIVFDFENEGKGSNWFRTEDFPTEKAREIAVPSCWEIIEKDYEGVGFYRHTFKIPARWKGKIVRLHFGAVNFISEVWVNDQAVGYHEGGFSPFELRIDRVMKAGEENTITMRVLGPILLTHKRIDGIGKMETPQWRGAITGGIWQSVTLIATDAVFVDDVFIEPKISDDTAEFHLEIENTEENTKPTEINVEISNADQPDKTVAAISMDIDLRPGSNKHNCKLRIKDAEYWSPDDPHLYRARVSVKHDNKVSDCWSTRFGMREFTIRDKKFYLNGKPMYLKAAFFEGLYPTKLAYPDSREMAIREIQLSKDAGFNMIRPWRKPPPPMWLDLADEMGVLVVGTLSVECMHYPVESARLPGWVANEVRESILRDRNRACVVQWELFNEIRRPVLERLLHPMAMLARELDPTRLILDESGGIAQGANMYLPYDFEPTKLNDIHDYPGWPINDAGYTRLLLTAEIDNEEMQARGLKGSMPGKNVGLGLMTVFSELGYGGLPDLVDNNRRFADHGNTIIPPAVYHKRLADEHRQALKESGFDKVYPDLKAFCLDQQTIQGIANKRMIEAVRCNPHVKGYCICAITAGNWVIGCGLLDLFRNPKTYAYEGTKAANQPRIVSIRVRPRNVYAERATRIEVTGVNELEAVKGSLDVEVVSGKGETVFMKTIEVGMEPGIKQLFSETLDTEKLCGTYTVKARVLDRKGSVAAVNEYDFDVFTAKQLEAPRTTIAVFDPANWLKPFLKNKGIAFTEFDSSTDLSMPVYVSRTEASDQEQRTRFDELTKFIKAGGTAVYLQGGAATVPWGGGLGGRASSLFPVTARTKVAKGMWTCIPHIVHDHPLFDGLPVNCMMGAIYENVWATGTLLDIKVKPIVGTIAFDFFPGCDRDKRHYYGSGDTWHGVDLAVIPVGKGRCIPSQLRLIENLDKDPVADKILFNLINFTAKN